MYQTFKNAVRDKAFTKRKLKLKDVFIKMKNTKNKKKSKY